MKKKKRKVDRHQLKQPKPAPTETTVQNSESAGAEKPFDFGGLPDRDLKKNLGCG